MTRFLFAAGFLILTCTAGRADDFATVRYRCDRGAEVTATYLNIGERSFAVISFEGRQLGFETEATGSGARYLSTDESGPFVWWTKGNEGALSFGAKANETVLHSGCREY